EAGENPGRKAHALQIAQRHESANERHGKNAGHQGQPPLDKAAGGITELPQDRRDHKEPQAARDDRGADERGEVEMRDAAGNRDQLVGNRGHPLDDDDPGAPLVETGLQRVVAVHRMVEFEDRSPDGVEQEIADRIAEQPARHRGEGAIGGEAPSLARPFRGGKEERLMNYRDIAPLLDDVEWDLHPGAPAPHGDWPVELGEEFLLVGARRLPIVREACESGKYNAIVLLGGGDPGFPEAREIARRYRI